MDDIFKCIFMNENVWIPIEFWLKFVPKGPGNKMPMLVKIMALHHPRDRQLSEPIDGKFTDAYICHSAWMSHSIILYENIWLIKINHDFYFIEVCF